MGNRGITVEIAKGLQTVACGFAVFRAQDCETASADRRALLVRSAVRHRLMGSLLFGTIGMGMLLSCKKAGRTMPLIGGLGLLTIPYFITSLAVMLVVCIGLTVSPWIVREG